MEELLELSEGSYSKVYFERKTKDVIKRLKKWNLLDFFWNFREFNFLTSLNGNYNFVHFLGLMNKNENLEKNSKIDNEVEGYVDDSYYFRLEHCSLDCNLFTYIFEHNDRLTLKIFVDVLLSLELLHKNGYVHRDIKPSNILLSFNDNKPYEDLEKDIFLRISENDITAKLCDFGFMAHKSSILPNELFYTWYFRPPEIFMKIKYEEKADIWALGITFLDILNKSHRFTAEPKDMINEIYQGKEKITDEECVYISKSPIRRNFPYVRIINRTNFTKDEIILLDEMISKMLNVIPNKRPSVDEILSSKLFNRYRDYINIKRAEIKIIKPVTLNNSNSKCFQQVLSFNKSIFENSCLFKGLTFKIFVMHCIFCAKYFNFIFYKYGIGHDKKIKKQDLELIILTILYICYKYQILPKGNSIEEFLGNYFPITTEIKSTMIKIENNIISNFNYVAFDEELANNILKLSNLSKTKILDEIEKIFNNPVI